MLLLNKRIARFGCPLAIDYDQGQKYQLEMFRELCQILEIYKMRTSPRNPQGNGSVERFNKTLIALIKSYLKGKPKKLDENLQSLYNALVHLCAWLHQIKSYWGVKRGCRWICSLLLIKPLKQKIWQMCDESERRDAKNWKVDTGKS